MEAWHVWATGVAQCGFYSLITVENSVHFPVHILSEKLALAAGSPKRWRIATLTTDVVDRRVRAD
eukprot:6177820-Alexandrium_andersonii.AAC.1